MAIFFRFFTFDFLQIYFKILNFKLRVSNTRQNKDFFIMRENIFKTDKGALLMKQKI
jgi:hypothetical protein